MSKKESFIIPRMLKILNTTWKINLNKTMKKGLLGQCNNTTRVIDILETENYEVLEDTFYHESTHALLMSCCGREHNTEDVVVPLAKGIKDFTNQIVKHKLNQQEAQKQIKTKSKEVKDGRKTKKIKRVSRRKIQKKN